jgi:hypothetical protein
MILRKKAFNLVRLPNRQNDLQSANEAMGPIVQGIHPPDSHPLVSTLLSITEAWFL